MRNRTYVRPVVAVFVLGSAAVPVTGGGQTWTEVTAPIANPGGTFELFLVAKNPTATGDLFNVNWFEFGHGAEERNGRRPGPAAAQRGRRRPNG